ncbi:hypothetical protein PALU110988_12885 [Paenibacillus lupini]|jgi:hypothetical protein|nr:hypothetical protein [Paenibacillus lupini]NIK26192.1 hypothetical protein [Paenibacillus lupini]
MEALISFIMVSLAFISGPFIIVMFGRQVIRHEDLNEANSKG